MRPETLCPHSRFIQRPDYLWPNISADPCVWISVFGLFQEESKGLAFTWYFLKASLPENARHISDVNSNVVLRVGDGSMWGLLSGCRNLSGWLFFSAHEHWNVHRLVSHKYSSISGGVMSPALFFFPKIILTMKGLVWFHTSSRTIYFNQFEKNANRF